MAKDKKITHYGPCPPGQIRDHNQGSKTYGKCIPIVNRGKSKSGYQVAKKRKPRKKGMSSWT